MLRRFCIKPQIKDTIIPCRYTREETTKVYQDMLKVQRNETCPCGSGKRYKKCCLAVPEKNAEILRALSIARTYDEIKLIVNKPMNIYRLKVELTRMGFRKIETDVSRTLDVDGKHTLYDLHMNIQDVFGWDNDHMFSFYLGEELFDQNNEYSANPMGEHIASGFDRPTNIFPVSIARFICYHNLAGGGSLCSALGKKNENKIYSRIVSKNWRTGFQI